MFDFKTLSPWGADFRSVTVFTASGKEMRAFVDTYQRVLTDFAPELNVFATESTSDTQPSAGCLESFTVAGKVSDCVGVLADLADIVCSYNGLLRVWLAHPLIDQPAMPSMSITAVIDFRAHVSIDQFQFAIGVLARRYSGQLRLLHGVRLNRDPPPIC